MPERVDYESVTQEGFFSRRLNSGMGSPGGGGTGSPPTVGGSEGGSTSSPKKISASVSAPAPPKEVMLADLYLKGELKPTYETVLDRNFGWNTRAHWDGEIAPGVGFRFKIPSYSVGVVVGLTRNPASTGYADIEYGVIQRETAESIGVYGPFDYGEARCNLIIGGQIYEPGGDDHFALPDYDAGWFTADRFPLASPGWENIEIAVRSDRIEFWTVPEYPEGVIGKYLLHSVLVEPSTWTLSAALYAGGDKVVGMKVFDLGPDFEIPKISVFASDEVDVSVADMAIPNIAVEAADFIEYVSADFSLPSIMAHGGDDVTVGNAHLPLVTALATFADDLPVIDMSIGYVSMPRIRMQSIARDKTFASVDIDLPGVLAMASEDADVSIGRADIPGPVRVWCNDIADPRRVEIVEFAFTLDGVLAFDVVYLVWSERLGAVGLFTLTDVERALIEARLRTDCTLSQTEIMQALLASVMSASDVASILGEKVEVWALHMDAMGSTRYEGYNFNSFATIGGVTYGAAEGGVYRLDGDDDDGAAIQSLVDFGSLNFGTNNRKALPYVYVGMASGGETVLKVESDGKTYFYEVRDSTDGMKTHRFELGRGLRSTFYGLALISEGPAFDLHNIEFHPVELTRRL